MTPRKFLSSYSFDERMVTGRFFPTRSLAVRPGDRVGVVLFNLGGPDDLDGIEPFLYNLFMDPAIIDIPLPAPLRDVLCRFIARRRSRSVRQEYALIGGRSPLNEHTRHQARLLERRLQEELAPVTGAQFNVYRAMRYAPPLSEDAAAEMERDGVDQIVLLPLYPQYSKTTTGASVVYWKALENAGEIPVRPTALVFEYATHPSLIRAFSERIDEGLRRFPEEEREDVHLLFSSHGTPLYELTRRKDPYCCLVHSTVDRIIHHRNEDRPHSVAFQSKVGPSEWLTPSTPDRLEELADAGVQNVLVVPVAFVSDHVETEFELEMEIRDEAEKAGIRRFEVTTGLNGHAHFIDALFDVTARACGVGNRLEHTGDGSSSRLEDLQPHVESERTTHCDRCLRVREAACWTERRNKPESASPATS